MKKITKSIVAILSAATLCNPITSLAATNANNAIAPSTDFLIERLSTIETISNATAFPGEKRFGYQAYICFNDQAATDAMAEHHIQPDDKITTVDGGFIDIFQTAEGAASWDKYLAIFDGNGFLDTGSHEVLGTCVIRTSKYLNMDQQAALTEAIKNAILATDVPGQVQNPTTVYNGVDYAAEYDAQTYYNNYPDLQAAFGTDGALLIKHYVEYGKAEGRKAK